MCCKWSESKQSRRHWLAGITAAGGIVAAGAVGQSVARAAEGPTAGLGPQDALDFLYAGNKRFAAGESAAPNRDISRLREVAPRQSPFAAVRENVRIQAQTLVEASTVISSLVTFGKVLVAGGVFDLESGRVQPVDLA